MATVTVDGDRLRVRFAGWERVWALSAGFDVPLAAVRDARVDPHLRLAPEGVRAGGTFLPRVVAAGRYWRPGFSSFWSVRDPRQAVVIDLAGWRYSRLVVQVDDPAAVVAAVRTATGLRTPDTAGG